MSARNKTFWMDLFCIVMFVGAIGTEDFTTKMLIKAREAKSWPITDGLILRSELVEKQLGLENQFDAKIRYRYEVGKEVFESENVRPRGTSSEYKSEVLPLVTRFPNGSKAMVYYNPRNPNESYLLVIPDLIDFVLVVAPLGFAFLFGAYLVARILGDFKAILFAT